MIFINALKMKAVSRSFNHVLLALSFTLFSACSFLGDSGSKPNTADATQNAAEQGLNPDGTPKAGGATQTGGTTTVQPAIPKENPYLSNRPPASKADKQLFAQALSAAKADKLDEATALFIKLTQQNPKLSGPYLNLGVIAQKQDQLEQAEAWFKKSIQANSNNLDAYTALALLYKDQAKFNEAKEQLTKAVTLWPSYPAGHRNLGILNEFYLGDYKTALKHYKTYQGLLEKPDRKVKGWIIDLERRIPPDPEEQKAQEAVAQAENAANQESADNQEGEGNSDRSEASSEVADTPDESDETASTHDENSGPVEANESIEVDDQPAEEQPEETLVEDAEGL